jgi:ATP-dependent Clp protease ATP-binding subunit ClpC
MFERFTDKGRKIIILAREEAERHQNDYLATTSEPSTWS